MVVDGVVVGGVVVGGADVGTVVPSPNDVVGPGIVVTGSVGGSVVPTGPEDRGAVVATVGVRVLVGVATGADPAVVVGVVSVVGSTVDEVEDDEVEDDEVGATSGGDATTGARNVVTGDRVATWRFGELSVPVATSNSRAARATDAST